MKIKLKKKGYEEAKVGCVIFTPHKNLEDCGYLIAEIDTKYRLIDLATGRCASKGYSCIKDLIRSVFNPTQDILIYPEELALVMNEE